MNIKINDGRQNLTEELKLNCKLITNDERNYLRENLLKNEGDKYIYLKINAFGKVAAEIDGESLYAQTKTGQDSIFLNHSSLGIGIRIKLKDLSINREQKTVIGNNLYFCAMEYYTGDMKDVYTSYIEPRFK